MCEFDLVKRTITIRNAFLGMTTDFNGGIKLYLSRIRNPLTNEGLLPYFVTTYLDETTDYPVDRLQFLPELICHWSCKLCSADKDYCTQCWEDKYQYMHQFGA